MSALWLDTVCVNWRAAGTISSFTGNTLGSRSPLNVIWHQEWKEQQPTISLVDVCSSVLKNRSKLSMIFQARRLLWWAVKFLLPRPSTNFIVCAQLSLSVLCCHRNVVEQQFSIPVYLIVDNVLDIFHTQPPNKSLISIIYAFETAATKLHLIVLIV